MERVNKQTNKRPPVPGAPSPLTLDMFEYSKLQVFVFNVLGSLNTQRLHKEITN